ncbi:hypothetical protein A0H81_12628 [Grifola frondosa]|uniref:Uncharacterized protein n=1 Tax=Grifola frondosa TaxID=5627 RepID=A0A1C7LSF4_GRIFR|nr:hypothetical protein A0H81_12628 [Grifola frondosa]
MLTLDILWKRRALQEISIYVIYRVLQVTNVFSNPTVVSSIGSKTSLGRTCTQYACISTVFGALMALGVGSTAYGRGSRRSTRMT